MPKGQEVGREFCISVDRDIDGKDGSLEVQVQIFVVIRNEFGQSTLNCTVMALNNPVRLRMVRSGPKGLNPVFLHEILRIQGLEVRTLVRQDSGRNAMTPENILLEDFNDMSGSVI